MNQVIIILNFFPAVKLTCPIGQCSKRGKIRAYFDIHSFISGLTKCQQVRDALSYTPQIVVAANYNLCKVEDWVI